MQTNLGFVWTLAPEGYGFPKLKVPEQKVNQQDW
jgi:hypothetical protein